MLPTKACPVVLRTTQSHTEILAFEHPRAGLQLVKGTIEAGERPADAAVRELREESGVDGKATVDLGLWQSGYQGQVWSLHICETSQSLPDTWVHHTMDDGGHDFRFFWHPLDQAPSDRWHWLFRDALLTIQWLLARHR